MSKQVSEGDAVKTPDKKDDTKSVKGLKGLHTINTLRDPVTGKLKSGDLEVEG